MPKKPDLPHRADVLRDAITEIYDGSPQAWLQKHFKGPGEKGVAQGTASSFLSHTYQPVDIPRIAIIGPLADQLRIRRSDMLTLWGREVGMVKDDETNAFTVGLDTRAADLDSQRRRRGHRLIASLCDEQETATENERLRALLAEHGIDPDA
ncbi:hypothetical protein [Kineosporia babensis]|uniref:Uncharacterized protein n=1 Tax=Kineosporia babensis TaxID=499548 RepID=A0A9X1SSR2_9ACTN|nr:hypothetical protein [Kineosporia babensis]MCD5310947.1 hypothetical protein [Kineosporia babensis]